MFDSRMGLSVVLPLPLFAQLIALAKSGIARSGSDERHEARTSLEREQNRSNVDERAIWYALPTDVRQDWLTPLENNAREHGKQAASAVNEVLARLEEELEEAADIAAYDAAVAGDEELFPMEVVRRLIEGEHPVKVFREYRGLTQAQLAKAVGIHPTYLSQIETRRRTGSTGLLRRLAAALGVTVDDLLEDGLED
jgi:DNA-binding XRE family transcriptional regulator